MSKPDGKRWNGVIRRMPSRTKFLGVEVGVQKGNMARKMLVTFPRMTLIMVDVWAGIEPGSQFARSFKREEGIRLDQAEYNLLKTVDNTKCGSGRRVLMHMTSLNASRLLLPGSARYVFIDACHDYEHVKEDILAWWPIVAPGGWLCGHDYEHPYEGFQVEKAVDEFVSTLGSSGVLELDDNYTWFVRKEA